MKNSCVVKGLIFFCVVALTLLYNTDIYSETEDIFMYSGRGETPEEEANRVIEIINGQYRNIMKGLALYWSEESYLVPVPLATRITGYIIVNGKDSEPPERTGWVPLEITYKVKQEFVGYLIITSYYDLKTGSFTDKKDYVITSYSTKIEVESVSGRECLETDHAIHPDCIKWGTFDKEKIEIRESEIFPHYASEVIWGGSKTRIIIDAPDIYFWASDKRGESLGCGRTIFKTPRSQFDFDNAVKERKLKLEKEVGRDPPGSPSPHDCELGSTIKLNMEICDPERFLRHFDEYYNNKCKQIESLIDYFAFAVRARDIYNQLANEAEVNADLFEDNDALFNRFIEEISKDFPDLDFEEMKKIQSAYDPENKEITVPDFCKCSIRPLCEWEKKFALIQEEANKMYVESNDMIAVKIMMSDSHRFFGEAFAEVEAVGYDERARYILSFINEQINENPECHFKPEFWIDLMNAPHKLNEDDLEEDD